MLEQNEPKQEEPTQERKPNDQAGFHFSSGIKITDPKSGEVLLQKRAD